MDRPPGKAPETETDTAEYKIAILATQTAPEAVTAGLESVDPATLNTPIAPSDDGITDPRELIVVPGWPAGSALGQRKLWWRLVLLAGDIAVAALPLSFLGEPW